MEEPSFSTDFLSWVSAICCWVLSIIGRKADDASRSLSASASKKELGMDLAGLKVQGIKIYQTPENEHVKERVSVDTRNRKPLKRQKSWHGKVTRCFLLCYFTALLSKFERINEPGTSEVLVLWSFS